MLNKIAMQNEILRRAIADAKRQEQETVVAQGARAGGDAATTLMSGNLSMWVQTFTPEVSEVYSVATRRERYALMELWSR